MITYGVVQDGQSLILADGMRIGVAPADAFSKIPKDHRFVCHGYTEYRQLKALGLPMDDRWETINQYVSVLYGCGLLSTPSLHLKTLAKMTGAPNPVGVENENEMKAILVHDVHKMLREAAVNKPMLQDRLDLEGRFMRRMVGQEPVRVSVDFDKLAIHEASFRTLLETSRATLTRLLGKNLSVDPTHSTVCRAVETAAGVSVPTIDGDRTWSVKAIDKMLEFAPGYLEPWKQWRIAYRELAVIKGIREATVDGMVEFTHSTPWPFNGAGVWLQPSVSEWLPWGIFELTLLEQYQMVPGEDTFGFWGRIKGAMMVRWLTETLLVTPSGAVYTPC